MSELIDRERFSADMRDFQNRVGIWRDEAEDTETRTRADAALATIIETKLILDKQPTIPAQRWHKAEDDRPKYTGRYLVWCGVNWCGEGMYGDMMIARYNRNRQRWYVEADESLNGPICGHIRYWIPIEPPKEGEA